MEYLDILDEKGDKTGETISFEEAHKSGVLHRAVHVWILNSNKELLLQKRGPKKHAYPNCWDMTASGHVSAGETSLEAAQKELIEEIGVEIPTSKFKYLFTLEEHIVLNNGTYINNSFDDVYLIRADVDLSKFKTTDNEVQEVRFISLSDLKEWINGEGEPMVPHEEEYKRLVELLSTN